MAPPVPQVVQIELSDEEWLTGVPEDLTIEKALTALHRDGIVVVTNAIDSGHLDQLNDKLVHDINELLKRPNKPHETHSGSGNFVHFPPLHKEYLFGDVYANPIAGAILNNILGPKPELCYIGTNTAFRGVERQPVHSDMVNDHLDIPFAMTVNIPLVDVSVENGATEFWLGTHHLGVEHLKDDGRDGPWIADQSLEKRRMISPPIRLSLPKGSFMIRDMRLWHAGIPNPTSQPRIMITLNHFPKWFRNHTKSIFPESSREYVETMSRDTSIAAAYIPDARYDRLAIRLLNTCERRQEIWTGMETTGSDAVVGMISTESDRGDSTSNPPKPKPRPKPMTIHHYSAQIMA
jgi:hypothetical protein